MTMGLLPIALICIALFIGLSYALLILPTQWLKIERIHHDMGLRRTVLHISDLHVERIRVSPDRIKRVIRQVNPDWIVLTGDYMDRQTSFPKIERYLHVLAASGKPCFAVLGNHDYHLGKVHLQYLIRLMREHGIRVLRNESLVVDGVQLVGIDDFCTEHDDADKAYRGVDETRPVVVLSHDPNLTLTLNHHYDILLSGHLHGKQFNIPFLFRINPMGPLPRMGIFAGLHRTSYGTYYISKGVGQSGLNARLFVRSEVTVHFL